MLTLNDGRSELWQWDTGRKLAVDADCSQVHFSNKVFGRSIDVDVVDGVASIPNILLQTDKDLTAWAFVGSAENGYTKISKGFKVNKRNKPANYVFTAPDQTTLGEILDRIEDLENRPSGDVSKEDIQNAVSDYLDKNPVSVEEKDPTVPAWAKQPEPPKVEIPEVDIPDALPNPHKLTFTGAVTAEYDGSEPVEVKIPEGGGGSTNEALIDETLTEAVVSYEAEFTKGYRYLEVYVACPTASGNTTNNNNLWFHPNKVQGNRFGVGALSMYGYTAQKTTIEILGEWMFVVKIGGANANSIGCENKRIGDPISSFRLIPNTSGDADKIPVGTRIVIKGSEEL